jgi:YtkA-like
MNWFCFRRTEENFHAVLGRALQVGALTSAISLTLWIGCDRAVRPSSNVTVAFESMPRPARVGAVTLDFTLADATAKPVVGAHLTTEADMTHAGMSPVFGTVEEKQPGRYESTLKLEMAGDWVILLRGKLPAGEKLERQFELSDVRPN